MVTRTTMTAGLVVLLATAAAAEPLPGWKIDDICRRDSAPGQCSLFEGRARNAVSASWGVLPPDVQTACIAATSAPAAQSWRELAGCIELETLHAKTERAIATARTPSQPEPTPQPASEPSAAQPAAPEPAGTTVPAASEQPAASAPQTVSPEPVKAQ